jgi:hypothetical protein
MHDNVTPLGEHEKVFGDAPNKILLLTVAFS